MKTSRKKFFSTSKENIYTAILAIAKKLPNKVCLQTEENTEWHQITYSQLVEKIKDYKKFLMDLKIIPGDRVVLITETTPDAVVIYLSLLAVNATVVILDNKLSELKLKDLISQSDAHAVVISKKNLSHVKSDLFEGRERHFFHNNKKYVFFLTENYSPIEKLDPKVATILFTSGTTGEYKGVMLTHRNFIYAVQVAKKAAKIIRRDSFFTMLPMYHVYPLVQNIFTPLFCGAQNTFVSQLEGEHILRMLQFVRPTILCVVPRIIELFVNRIEENIKKRNFFLRTFIKILQKMALAARTCGLEGVALSLSYPIRKVFGGRIKKIISGGAPLRKDLEEKMENFGFSIYQGYGLTETTGGICINRHKRSRVGTVGVPHPKMKIYIDKKTDGEDGEILVKGPLIMKGYFRDKQATNEAIKDGWLHTGDLGQLDRGFLTVTGRSKEIIVTSGGKKAVPSDVESYYQNIPGIKEFAVTGVLKENLDADEIYAAVVVEEHEISTHYSLENLQEKIKKEIFSRASHIPFHLQITQVHFLDALPKTNLLKIKRKELAKKIVEARKNKTKLKNQYKPIELHEQKTLDELTLILADVIGNSPIFSSDTHLSELGIDSLMALHFINQLREKYGDKISPEMIYQNPTVLELVRKIHQPKVATADVIEQHPAQKRMVIAAEQAIKMNKPLKIKKILLTGVTGVLGAYILKTLLEEENVKVFCLTRAPTQEAAKQRIMQFLAIYPASKQKMKGSFYPVLGDVTQENLGLSQQEYDFLVREIDLVIHSAAKVSLHGIYQDVAPVNVAGTRNMMQFTLKTAQKYMLYISSYSQFGDALFHSGPLLTEKDFDVGQNFPGLGYQQTKFEAEKMIREATSAGLRWIIVRPGDIFGDSVTGAYPLGITSVGGIYYDILKTILETNVAMMSPVYFDITPVDYVSRATIYLALHHQALYGTYHLKNPAIVRYEEIIRIIQRCGYSLQTFPVEVYLQKLKQRQLMKNGKEYFSTTTELLKLHPEMAIAAQYTYVDSIETQNILASANIICPTINERLLATYLQYCINVGYINL